MKNVKNMEEMEFQIEWKKNFENFNRKIKKDFIKTINEGINN